MTKCLELFAEVVEMKDEYEKFYEQFATCLKLGIHEGSINRAKGAELLRLSTSKCGDEQVCLKEYIDRVKEGQSDMYHNTGDRQHRSRVFFSVLGKFTQVDDGGARRQG